MDATAATGSTEALSRVGLTMRHKCSAFGEWAGMAAMRPEACSGRQQAAAKARHLSANSSPAAAAPPPPQARKCARGVRGSAVAHSSSRGTLLAPVLERVGAAAMRGAWACSVR